MTDQERPRDPGEPPEGITPDGTQPEQPAVPESEQPTIGWAPPTSPTPPPSTWGAESPPPPPLEPTPPPPSTWDAQPPPPPPASGPLLSASPSSAAGWTQPTQAAPGQPGLPPGLVFSATAPRFVAYLIDGFLLAIVGSVVNGVFGARVPFDPSSAGGFATRFTGGDVAATIVTVVISGAYFIGFWSGGRRATLGQMALRIQVGNAFDGKALTVTQAAKRWLALGEFLQVFAISVSAAAAIASAGFLWAIVLFITTATSPTKQGLHDKFANSAVVRPVGASNALVWGCLILLALVIIVPILLFAALFPQMSTVLSEIGQSI